MLYNSVMFLSNGDLYPRTKSQNFNAVLLLYLAGFFNFFLFGKLGNLAEDYQSKSSMFQMRLDETNELINYLKMSEKS